VGLIAASAVVAAHAAAALFVATRAERSRSRRQLGVALSLTIPVFGIPLAIAAVGLAQRGGSPALADPARPTTRRRMAELRDRKPMLDRLAGDTGDRRAALARAVNDASAQNVELLRWVVDRADGDAVIESAMTLEELEARHSERIARAKTGLGSSPTAQQLIAVADMIADLLFARLADPTLAPRIAADARGLYQRAAAKTDGKPLALYERWARLELAASRPDAALALLEHCDEPSDDGDAERLRTLRGDARFAARRKSTDPGARVRLPN
jgi:hypothetical protein